MISLLRKALLHWTGRLPKDIVAILAQRLWQAGAGLVTVVIAVRFLSAEEQGWYYSFLSLSALYTLLDLGLSLVLVQVAAHHFVGLQWRRHGAVAGRSRARMLALLSSSVRWYGLLSVLFIALALPGGLLFFGATAAGGPSWVLPWITLVVATGSSLLNLPYLAILEGSGRVTEVYAIRLTQGVLGSLACWTALVSGKGLWATVMTPAMGASIPLLWLAMRRRSLLRAAWRDRGAAFDWRREVWPLQWRLALGWLCAYLMTQIYTPVLFRTHGAVAAGQMGLSLAIVNTLGLLAQSWIVRRVPAMARAAAQRNWPELDRLFAADFMISIAMFLVGAATLAIGYFALAQMALIERLLPFWQFSGLLGVAFLQHIIGGLAAHLRSLKREPIVVVTVLMTLIAVPAGLLAAAAYSSAGIVFVLFFVNFIVGLPLAIYLWKSTNQEARKAA